MPNFRFNTRSFALLAACFALWGCPQTPGTGTSNLTDDPGSDGISFPGQATPRPSGSATPKPSPTPTPTPTAKPSATPTPSPSPSVSTGPTPTPKPLIRSVLMLNRISQMWLLEQSPTASPPVSIPSTFSFQAEVVTVVGNELPSTSSSVVWTSSNPAILSIDRKTGYATANVGQGLYLVTIQAATSNPLASDTSTKSDYVTVTVGNSGTLDVTIE
ncbi:MAG TPA: hypothetical protein V6D05_14680 [Stenomitos sp.]